MTIGLPCGDHNDVGFDFTSVVEKRTRFVESLELWSALDLDLIIDDHSAGPDVWETGEVLVSIPSSMVARGGRIFLTNVKPSGANPHEPDETRVVITQ
jgi:hypothetical protein